MMMRRSELPLHADAASPRSLPKSVDRPTLLPAELTGSGLNLVVRLHETTTIQLGAADRGTFMPVINIRISADEKKRLAEIAAAQGMSLSAFLREAAIKKAYEILGPPTLVQR